MRYGVLGPLLLRPGGHPVRVVSAKPRAVLALLMANRGRPVRVERLIDELWPDSPPASAVANIRTYVSALRLALGPEDDRLSTRPGAYLLELGDDDFDAAVFEKTVRLARSSRECGDLTAALDLLGAALALWRGEALEDVPTGAALTPYRETLAGARLNVLEQHLDARFESGDSDGAVAGLRELTAAHPVRETAWHLLIRSLYRLGDRAAALDAYREVTAVLADHLGLDPAPRLQALHTDILRGRPPGRPVPAPGAPRTPLPRQLPKAPGLLVGRTAELSRIQTALTRRDGGHPTGLPRIVAVVGTGGMGKSTLAVAAAHALADAFPDGQLYADLRANSSGRPLQPVRVLGLFLRALGAPNERISPDPAEAVAWFRSYCADRRLLVVLDNVVDHRQAQQLLPSGPGCAALLTSRHPLDTLDDVERIPLGELEPEAALDMLRRLAGAQRVDAEPASADAIVRLCGLMPLAIRVVGARMARHHDLKLAVLADRLRTAHSRLDELGFADLDVRSTFELGYQALRESPGGDRAALLFRRMGALRTTEVPTIVAAGLLDVDPSTADRALDLLRDHGLLEQHGRHHHLHDLQRVYAGEIALDHEPEAGLVAASGRVADRYVRLVRRSRVLYRPLAGEPPHDESLPDDEPVPRTSAEAAEWMSAHLAPIRELVEQFASRSATVHLAYELVRPLSRRLWLYHPVESIQLHEPLLASTDTAAPTLVVPMLCGVANAHLSLSQYDQAAVHARRALRLLPGLDDGALRARVLSLNAWTRLRAGDPLGALSHFGEVISGYTALRQASLVAVSLNNAAQATFALERYDDTLALLRRSLALTRYHDDPALRAAVLDSLAMTYARLECWRAVCWHAGGAVTISEQVGDTLTLCSARQYRALARHALGQTAAAVVDAEAAVAVARTGGRPSLELESLRVLAGLLWMAGDPRADLALRRADAFAATLRPDRGPAGG